VQGFGSSRCRNGVVADFKRVPGEWSPIRQQTVYQHWRSNFHLAGKPSRISMTACRALGGSPICRNLARDFEVPAVRKPMGWQRRTELYRKEIGPPIGPAFSYRIGTIQK
jgi:hypothetical protein